MSWQILIGLSVVSYSFSILLQRIVLKESNSKPVAYSIFFQLINGIFIGLVGFLISDMNWPSNWILLLPNLILMTLLYGFGSIFIFKSLKETEASLYTIIFALRAFFTTFASSLLLKEFLNFQQFVGAMMIFTSVVLVSYKSQKLRFRRGELYALLAALCFGFANTNDRYLLSFFNVYVFLMLAFIIPAVVMGLIYRRELKYIRLFFDKKIIKKVFLMCMIYSFSAITFFVALQISPNSSQVANINITNVIVTVILSIILLKEREGYLKKIIGAILSFLGVFLIK